MKIDAKMDLIPPMLHNAYQKINIWLENVKNWQ